MPEAFEACQRAGGRIRTFGPSSPLGRKHHLKAGQYIHYCFKGKKAFPGEIHTKTSEAYRRARSGS